MVDDQGGPGHQPRFQVRLVDLVMAVLGSGFVLDVTRRSMVAWGGGWPDGTHATALVVLALSVGFALMMGGQGVQRLRDRGEGSRSPRIWGFAWRGLAVVGLAWLVSEGTAALEVEASTIKAGWVRGYLAEMRLKLIPLTSILAMVGLVLASSPIPARRAVPKSGRGWTWLSVIVAGLGGLVMLAAGWGLLPYLVLLAMEAVRNALTRAPLVPHPSLFERFEPIGLEAGLALAVCLATAVWLVDDLKAASSDPIPARIPRSSRQVATRLFLVILTVIAAGYLVMVTIPRLSPHLAQGIAWMIDPTTMGLVLVGFGTLALGLAARSASRLAMASEPLENQAGAARGLGKWPKRVMAGLAGVVAVEVTASAIQAITKDLTIYWAIPLSLENWLLVLQAPARWLYAPSIWSSLNPLIDRPGDILILVGVIWIPVRVVIALVGKGSERRSAIDLVVTDRLALGRFLGWWAALTALMVASLPILAVASVFLAHLGIQWLAR